MALPSSSCSFAIVALSLFLVLTAGNSSAHLLRRNFYHKTCPNLFHIVRSVVESVVSNEPVLGAGLLRLFFHDCFVNGCDASILLDDTSTFTGEKTAGPNNGSIRGYEVIDEIKFKVEQACPAIVSCADIVYIAARDSVVLLGGPKWKVKLGRRDSKTANKSLAESGVLPSPVTSNLTDLISAFEAQGLSTRDMVALSGGHTIGQARCPTFARRVYNETNIDPSFAKAKQNLCPLNNGPTNYANLDVSTPNYFDNGYFKNLLKKKGLLHSDQVLFNGGSTDSLVRTYAQNKKAFVRDFIKGMIRMGGIKPLVYPNGEIRKNCRKVN